MFVADPVLCVDVGNSRTKFGLFRPGTERTADELPECSSDLAVPHGEPIAWETLGKLFSIGGGTIVRVLPPPSAELVSSPAILISATLVGARKGEPETLSVLDVTGFLGEVKKAVQKTF